MTTNLDSLTSIAANQMELAARFGAAFVDAMNRVVSVQIEAANSALQDNAKSAQPILSRDLAASPAELSRLSADWVTGLASSHSRLAQNVASKLQEASLRTQTEFNQIASEQWAVFSNSAKHTIAGLTGESSRLLAGVASIITSFVVERPGGEAAIAVERQTEKAA